MKDKPSFKKAVASHVICLDNKRANNTDDPV